MRESATPKTKRALVLEVVKGPLVSLLRLREMGFNLNKREFRDPIKVPAMTGQVMIFPPWGNLYGRHAIICKRCRFVIQQHNELRDLDAELSNTVCSDIKVEPVL